MAANSLSYDDVDFVEEPSRDYFCPVTLELLREPHQTLCCGNHISLEAVITLQKSGKPCPLCKEPRLKTLSDKFFGRKVNELPVRCLHYGDGCAWTRGMAELQRHLEGECEFEELDCPYSCGHQFRRGEVTEHLTNACPQRPFKCEYCGHNAKHCEITNQHYAQCEKFPHPCPNNCGETIERRNFQFHLKICPQEAVECEFSQAGCTATLPRVKMAAHKRQSVEEHLAMAGKTISTLTLQMATVLPILEELRDQTQQLRARVASLESQPSSPPTERHADLYQSLRLFSLSDSPQPGDGAHLEPSSNLVPPPRSPRPRSPPPSSLLVPPLILIMTGFEQHRASKDLWFSPPFFSHPGGYKFCLRVAANSPEASQQYVSMQAFLMRGEYDDELIWPFKGTVSVQLVNQRADKDHIEWTAAFDETVGVEAASRVTLGERASCGVGHGQLILHSDLAYNPAWPWNTEYLKCDCLKFMIADVSIDDD